MPFNEFEHLHVLVKHCSQSDRCVIISKVSWCIFVAVIVLVVFVVRTQHEIHAQHFFKCTVLIVKYS